MNDGLPSPNVKAREIFLDALDQPTLTARTAYLDRACKGDSPLRAAVEELLRNHKDDGFLESPAVRLPRAYGSAGGGAAIEKPGDHIGPYKLLEQLGEGGFGIVYLAEQEKSLNRVVALKVIKLGMDTKQVISRFESERQALALMDHTNIAKVLDAGATETGRPYFVMELVRGMPITNYCDQNKLNVRERLELFAQVCAAVQHAHQKGVIHRDIKPSNVLVTVQDDKALPKVIDFGVAKATAQKLTEKTHHTQFHQFIGTPAYMSPEQAGVNREDIDTRSDIYSLGVLLYELLTGSTPFDKQRLLDAGIEATLKMIREEEPPKPSLRLKKLGHEELERVASRRSAEPNKLFRQVRGDLDWIVMKALEKNRARRYDTASGLSGDIQRHLESEPVLARRPSNLYRIQKMVHRNKLATAFIAVVSVVLFVGLGLFIRLEVLDRDRRRALLAEDKAHIEATKSRQVAQFLENMLNSVGTSLASGGDTIPLQEMLDDTSERLINELKDQPGVEAELQSTIGGIYEALGQHKKAEAMHRQALAIRIKLLGRESPEVIASLNNLANALFAQGRSEEAESTLREALALKQKVPGSEAPDLLTLLNNLADLPHGDGEKREMIQREILEQDRSRKETANLGGDEPAIKQGQAYLKARPMDSGAIEFRNNLAIVLFRQGKRTEAEALYRKTQSFQKMLAERGFGPLILQPGPGEGNSLWTTSVFCCGPDGNYPGGALSSYRLRVGGWDDLYYSLLQFDLAGSPTNASSAVLYLYCFNLLGDGTPMVLDRITESWDQQVAPTAPGRGSLRWADRPPATQWRNDLLPIPKQWQWYAIDITDLYNAWKNGTYPNYGLQLRPLLNSSNNFNEFYSANYLGNMVLRPKLVITPGK